MKLYSTNTYTVFTQNTQEKLPTISNKSNMQSSLDYIKSRCQDAASLTVDLVFTNAFFLYRKVMTFLFNYCCI